MKTNQTCKSMLGLQKRRALAGMAYASVPVAGFLVFLAADAVYG